MAAWQKTLLGKQNIKACLIFSENVDEPKHFWENFDQTEKTKAEPWNHEFCYKVMVKYQAIKHQDDDTKTHQQVHLWEAKDFGMTYRS